MVWFNQGDRPMVYVKAEAGQGIPQYVHASDAGADLEAYEDVGLWAGHNRMVSTGLSVEIPDGYVGLVVPRSGLAAKAGVTVLNSPGVIDSGYRGVIKVNLVNHGPHTYHVRRGDRIAQLLVQPVASAIFKRRDELTATDRGPAGHGSTGV